MKSSATLGATLAATLLAATGAAARDLPDGIRARGADGLAAGLAADPQAALAEGRALLAAANPVQAIAAFRAALDGDPRSLAALNGLGVAYDRLGRSDLARQQFEAALALDPEAADIAYNLGWSLLKAGQARAAIAPLQRAVAGRDARAAAAARRALAMVAAQLENPATEAAAPPVRVAAARIDLVASGEAVLVLPTPVAPARPVQMARIAVPAPSPAPSPTPPVVAVASAAAPVMAPAAPVLAGLAQRLGEAAALTVPVSSLPASSLPANPAPEGEAAEVLHLTDRPPELPAPPPPAPRLAALVTPARPAQPARPETPAIPAAIATPVPIRLWPLPALAAGPAAWLAPATADPAATWRSLAPPAAPAMPADPRDRIRMAIARLERLVALIEASRG